MIVDVPNLGEIGLVTDVSANALPINGWTVLNNARAKRNRIEPVYGFSALTTLEGDLCAETSQEITSDSFWDNRCSNPELLTPVYSSETEDWTFDYDMDTDTGIDAWLVSYTTVATSRPDSVSVTLEIDRTSGKTVPNSLILNVWLTEWEGTSVDENEYATLGVALTFDTTGLGASGRESVTVSGDITYPADNAPKAWGVGALRFADTPTEFSADAVFITNITFTGCNDWWAGA